jgi:hypothetical protein
MESNRQKADRMSKALVSHVNAVLLAEAHAKLKREQMDEIDRECIAVLAPRDRYDGSLITEPRLLWHMTDEAAQVYYAHKHEILKARGYPVSEVGDCPALVAENLLAFAQSNLVEGAAEFFPGITPGRLMSAGMTKYREFVRLLIGLVTNHPSYRPPAILVVA